MIGILILGFIYGYALGNARVMSEVKKIDREVHKQIVENTRTWWNGLLDAFKAKTKEQKIEELKEEIEELEKDE